MGRLEEYASVYHECKRKLFKRISPEDKAMEKLIGAMKAEGYAVPEKLLQVSVLVCQLSMVLRFYSSDIVSLCCILA